MPYLLRPIQKEDLDTLCHFAKIALHGILSLPNDRELLRKKIEKSLASFQSEVKIPYDELYLFALVDLETNQMVGVSGIASSVGIEDPFYSYKIKHFENSCPSLGIYQTHAMLHLNEIRKGPTEICTLFLLPEYRSKGISKLLSYGRFLFMKAFPDRFHQMVLAEMRGVIDDTGYSPFWEHVLKPFFNMPFPQAVIERTNNENFIKDLMPKFPIYVDMLPKEVQNIIGKPHPATEPAFQLLKREGFEFFNEVDIFDAGPDIYASLQQIRTIRESRLVTVKKVCQVNSDRYLISNASLDFKATFGQFDQNCIDPMTALILDVNPGNLIDYVTLH